MENVSAISTVPAIHNELARRLPMPSENSHGTANQSDSASLMGIKAGEPAGIAEADTQTHFPGQLNDAVKQINDFMQRAQLSLQFSIDQDTNTAVIEIKDVQTGDIIRQIPSKEVLEIAKRLNEVTGLLFRGKA